MSTNNKFLQFDKDSLHQALMSLLCDLLEPFSVKYKIDLQHCFELFMNDDTHHDLKEVVKAECEKNNVDMDQMTKEVATVVCGNDTYQQIMQAHDAHNLKREQSYDKSRCFKNSSTHEHCLTYNAELWDHYCNVCGKQKLPEAYRCGRCDFDCCLDCTHKAH